MFKDMRKSSLAIGSAATLAFTGLVSVPAANAADMDITSLYGSTLVGAQATSTAVDAGIVLNGNTGLTGATAIDGDDAASTTHWLVEIVAADVTWGDIFEDGDLTGGTVPSTATAENDIQFWVGDGTAFATGRTATGVGTAVAPLATDTSFVIEGSDAVSNNLRIAATYADTDGDEADLVLTVTQFLDIDGDNRNDDGQAGTAATVTLKADDAVTFTTTYDYAELGEDTISGQITSNINLENFIELESVLEAQGDAEFSMNLDSDDAGATAVDTLLTLDGLGADAAGVTLGNATAAANTFEVTVTALVAAQLAVGDNVSIVNVDTDADTSIDGTGEITDITGTTVTILADAGIGDGDGAAVKSDGGAVALVFQTASYNSLLEQIDFEFAPQLVGDASNSADVIAEVTYTLSPSLNGTAVTNDAETGFFATDADATVDKEFVDNSVNNVEAELAQGASNWTGTNNDLLNGRNSEVLEGTDELDFTVTVWTDAAQTTAVGANVEVQVTLTDNGLGDTVLTAEGESLEATGLNTASFVLTTDLQGQVEFTVAAADGMDAGDSFQLDVTSENVSITQQTITWAEEDYTLVQYPAGNFSITPGGTVSVEYLVRNQFGDAPEGNFQLAVTRGTPTGDRALDADLQANWSYAVPVSSTGRATVTIVDNGDADTEGGDTVTVTLQEAATAGGGYIGTDAGDVDTFTLSYSEDVADLDVSVLASNNGVAIGSTAVYPVELEAETLVDVYTALGDADPEYSDTNAFNNKTDETADTLLRVYGRVVDADNAGVSGVAVEMSAAGLNFANANTSAGASLMLNDSIIVFTDASGDYEAWVRSSTGGKQTIAVAAQGATGSVDVTFETSTGAADAMTLDLAASVLDGRTADVKVTVVDAAGNPVSGVTVTFKESGPGYLNTNSGDTDADGEVIVNLITVSGDTGTSTITATATIDGVSTSVSDTITVGTAAASADQKVNAGSFKGYVALYAKGYAGQRMSAKVGNDWVVVPVLASNFERVVEYTGAGYTVAVRIYIDRVLIDTITVTTK